ncbi:MAG: DsbA family oxidoreductase [Sphingomonadaceae bacterium]|nr:DsbA family oxidoreductase [Sphingomonadaceae bacterium]
MATALKIDFISDISCPWCVIGLRNMESALASIGDDIETWIRFEPFELNPDMPVEGIDRADYFKTKYQLPEEEAKRRGGEIKARAEETGFAMNTGEGFRIYNTFDAHRLLEWAAEQGKQRALKHALFEAYFSAGKSMGDHEALADVAQSVGLDRGGALEILGSDSFADKVRAVEKHNYGRGIQSVPTIIVNGEYVINGGQPPHIYEKAFRHIAGEVPKAEAPVEAATA